MTPPKPNKSQYTESEAAAVLGVTIEELRTLIKSHISDREEDLNNVATAIFEPADILMLKFKRGQSSVEATV